MSLALQTIPGGMAAAAIRLTAAAEQVARIEAGPTGTGLPEAARLDLSQDARDRIEARTGTSADPAAPAPPDQGTHVIDVRV